MDRAGGAWVRPDDAERLVLGVELVLHQWRHDVAEAVAGLDRLLRMATPEAVVVLEGAYRRRHHSLAALLDTDRDVLLGSFGMRATAVAALLSFDRSGYLREAGVRWLAGAEVRLRALGHTDAAELYRDTIRNHDLSRGAPIHVSPRRPLRQGAGRVRSAC
jgi:hypothetical protein